VLIAIQVSVAGLYLAPVFKKTLYNPPQTIISLPVHTAVNPDRIEGALVVLIAVQLSVLGLYLPPVLTQSLPVYPPHTIISVPVHTAA